MRAWPADRPVLLACDADSCRSTTERLLGALPDHVLAGIQDAAGRRRSEADLRRSAVGRLLLDHALRGPFDAAPYTLACDRFGRPFLEDHPEIDFNISHSGRWVVCLVARDRQVGVDVEGPRPIEPEVMRYLHPDEVAAIQELPASGRAAGFLGLWTAKEAYLKALGTPLQVDLRSFSLTTVHDRIALGRPAPADSQHWAFEAGELPLGYRYTCCYTGGVAPVERVTVDDSKLLSRS